MFCLDDSFYQDEVRDGFFVSAQVKAAWAAELCVLNEVDRICQKNNIEYFIDWGTFLGAVRHEGIVPWDDDFDIAMTRENYDKFCNVAHKEFEEGFSLINLKNPPNTGEFSLFLARVTNTPKICFEKEHLTRFHNFPYVAGIDIFVLDYVNSDATAEDKRIENIKYILDTADSILYKRASVAACEEKISRIETICNTKLDRLKNRQELSRDIYLQAEKIIASVDERDSKFFTQMISFGLKKRLYINKEYAEEKVFLPFEGMRLPAWGAYEKVLHQHYRAFMIPNRSSGAHNYPFFEKQKENLEKISGMRLPEFCFSKELLSKNRISSSENMKANCREFLDYLLLQGNEIYENLNREISNETMEMLASMQQFAIDFGNWIEGVKWEGHPCVQKLADLCDCIFSIYSLAEAGLAGRDEGNFAAELDNFSRMLEKIRESILEEIIKKEEIVFLLHKRSNWKYFEKEYYKALDREDADVILLVIPYYYKAYDGSLINPQDELTAFEPEFRARAGETFDLLFHQPSKIYYDNPFDQWNFAISVSPEYYSDKLRQASERLIYIQPYDVGDFEMTDGRSYKVMDYYVTMPGVIRADEIHVNSNCIRQRYAEKLSEFAGEKEDFWLDKIFVYGEKKSVSPAKEKIIYVYIGIGRIIWLKNKALDEIIDKIRLLLGTEAIKIVWYLPRYDYDVSKESEECIRKYYDILETYNAEGKIELAEKVGREDIRNATAYYGSECHLAYEFMSLNKPVMICNLDMI